MQLQKLGDLGLAAVLQKHERLTIQGGWLNALIFCKRVALGKDEHEMLKKATVNMNEVFQQRTED